MTKSGCVEEDFVMQEITDNKSILQKSNPNFPSMTQTQIQATNVR
jgi:hypothetical protein